MFENRRYIVIGAFCLVGLIYIARLFYIQVLDDSYSLGSSKNSVKRVIEIPYRGQVYDRNGKLIVYNTPVYDLYVTPKQMKVPDTLAFCRMMNITRQEFDSLINQATTYSPFKPSLFLRQLSKEDFARIQDALVDYRGFEPRMSSMRTYPAHTLANALGYVSEITKKQLDEQATFYYRQGDYIGHNGLEEQYEEELRGKRGVRFVMQNVRGVVKGSYKNGEFDTVAVAGQNLYTGIDLDVQQYADSLMANKVGSVIAIEPATGEILVSVSAPTYDPNMLSSRFFSKNYGKLLKNPYKPLVNRPVMASYRPGSTFKLIQALVAQQQGSLFPNTAYSHAGSPMRCHCHGVRNLSGAVQYSCNPYFYHVFRKMLYFNGDPNTFKASAIGLQQWYDAVKLFGIGQKLGIDLPTEYGGKLPSVEFYDKVYKGQYRWKFSNIYSLSIGEGELLISPLKLANVAAIIANRGYYIPPHYAKGVGKVGSGIDATYYEKRQVNIDPKYFGPVIEGMRGAVVHGTVTPLANIADVELCGKTGTSQNAKMGHKYDHSIFVGFAPINNPKIAIAVFVENAGWGGKAAASVAALVVERYLKRKTEALKLDESVKAQNYMLNVGVIGAKPAQKKKLDSLRKDTTRKAVVKKPLMTNTAPAKPASRTAAAGVNGN
nr:penicillin-binding transpeptidase domain-containing protein [uncultured Arsenicibacter sp.]